MHVWPLHAGLVNHEWILGSGSRVIECVCVWCGRSRFRSVTVSLSQNRQRGDERALATVTAGIYPLKGHVCPAISDPSRATDTFYW